MKKELTIKQLVKRIEKEGPDVIQDLPSLTKSIKLKTPYYYHYLYTDLDILIQDLSFMDPNAKVYRTKLNGERVIVI